VVLAGSGPYRDIQAQPVARFGIDARVETLFGSTLAGRLGRLADQAGLGSQSRADQVIWH
jgi:hypothetical protein